jgi:hypothetical protein
MDPENPTRKSKVSLEVVRIEDIIEVLFDIQIHAFCRRSWAFWRDRVFHGFSFHSFSLQVIWLCIDHGLDEWALGIWRLLADIRHFDNKQDYNAEHSVLVQGVLCRMKQ